ncbi:DUF4142 domain-containing protein [Chryseosolibacter indicus]|uniref:DUF4142 domain-containing protein n=1 Tax=Chryseosolibacter indicus TaxID=2782351 RepID=A0ABS5VM78_9BACT|nr:DUF4142 domain-containing protein [Chryseosolibacter indicus]MBT1702221.1 DUF4142 domain-containing protein [Chryseosolibacter indicus]
MKTIYQVFVIAVISMILSCNSSNKDSVKQAQEQNLNSAIDEEISRFMTEAADARMMDIEEGKLAATKATTPELKQYGEWMVADHTKMLRELRMLAASKNIILPNTLSNKKADGLEDLKGQQGQDFDEKFIEMMKIDHKRDVNDFEDATDFKDKDIQKFAETYLPIVESHLEKIKQLEENKRVSSN